MTPVDTLIVAIAEAGRAATDAELREIVAHVAAQGFYPTAVRRVGGRAAGME